MTALELPFAPTAAERRRAWRGLAWYQHAPSCWGALTWRPVQIATIRRFAAREFEVGDRAAAWER